MYAPCVTCGLNVNVRERAAMCYNNLMENLDGMRVKDAIEYLTNLAGHSLPEGSPQSWNEYERIHGELTREEYRQLANHGIGEFTETEDSYKWRFKFTD